MPPIGSDEFALIGSLGICLITFIALVVLWTWMANRRRKP